MEPVYQAWLQSALLMGAITMPNGSALPASKIAKFSGHEWQARRWEWVDPRADIEALSSLDKRQRRFGAVRFQHDITAQPQRTRWPMRAWPNSRRRRRMICAPLLSFFIMGGSKSAAIYFGSPMWVGHCSR